MLKYFMVYVLSLGLYIGLTGSGLNKKRLEYPRCLCNYCYTFSPKDTPTCWCNVRTCKCEHCRTIVKGRTK